MKTKVLFKEKKASFDISSILMNAHPEAQIIAASKTGQTFRKMYLLGDSRAVKRKDNEIIQNEK